MLWHDKHKEQHSVTAPSYSRNQTAAGLVCVHAQVHQSVSPHKAQGFHITAPFSRVSTVFPGSASFGWPAVQFVCCDCVRLGEGGNKGGGQAWLLCLSVSHMSEGCNANNATPAKRMQVIVCRGVKKKEEEKTHYPTAIITPHDKSRLVSRWIMLMLVACAHRVRRLASSTATRRRSAYKSLTFWPLPHAKQPRASGRPAQTLMVQSNNTPRPPPTHPRR